MESSSAGVEDTLTLTADGPFAFAKSLPVGAEFQVRVMANPDRTAPPCSMGPQQLPDGGWVGGQPMVVMPAGSEPSDLALYCDANTYTVSARVAGLADGGSFMAFNQGAHVRYGANGTFPFPQRFATGSTWFINISDQPPGQTCSVVPRQGTIAGADVIADITCTP